MFATRICFVLLMCVLVLPASAGATFPGSNGALAYTVYNSTETRSDRYSFDGDDLGSLTGSPGRMSSVSYSPDGARMIGYVSNEGPNNGVYVGNADGTGLTSVHGTFAQGMFLADGRIALFTPGTGANNGTIAVLNDKGQLEPAFANANIPGTGVSSIRLAPDSKSLYYLYAGVVGVRPDVLVGVDLTNGASRTVLSNPANGGFSTIGLLDVSPNSKTLLITLAATGEKSGGDRIAPYSLNTIDVDGANPRLLATKSGDVLTGTFAPDGRHVAYAGNGQKTDAALYPWPVSVHIMELDGTNDRRLATYPQGSHKGIGEVRWQPGPPLIVDITGDQLIGDTAELDLSLENVSTGPFRDLRYARSSHRPGLIFNTAAFAKENRAGFYVIAGPAPTLLDVIGPMKRSVHQYLVGMDTPGAVQVRAEVTATSDATGPIKQTKTSYIIATNRDFTPMEERMAFIGGGLEIQNQINDDARATYNRTTALVNNALQKSLPRSQRRSARQTTALERELAQREGLPDRSLSWLPASTPQAIRAFVAYKTAKRDANVAVTKRKLGSAYTFAVQTPLDYWLGAIPGDPQQSIGMWDSLADEGAYWSDKAATGVDGYATRATELLTDPDKQDEFLAEVDRTVVEIDKKLAKLGRVAPAQARKIAAQIAKDPVKGASALGTVHGTIEAEVGYATMETLIGRDRSAVGRGIKNAGNGAKEGLELVDDIEEAGRTLKTMANLRRTDDALPTAAKLGMPKTDQDTWSKIVSQVEKSAKSRGYDVDLQLSFRPRNEFSATITNGLGKNQFMKKGKAGTELDVLLGMDPAGLGKYSVYSPKLPKGYKDLPPSMKDELLARAKDMREAHAEWFDPRSNVGRARRKNGVELRSTIGTDPDAPRQVTKIKFKLSGTTKNGTTVVSYDELIVDGKRILKRGAKRRPVVSDYDGNAILLKGGKALPAGVRGFIELEVMRLSREIGGDKAISFHGFTHNGFDVGDTTYRAVFKYTLEGMSEQQAKRHLAKYMNKFRAADPNFNDRLDTYKYGDYVVRVTSDGASVGQGL